jgi:hypothetical protein
VRGMGTANARGYRPWRGTAWLAAVAALVLLSGCASGQPEVRRTGDGPGAEDVFRARFRQEFGREPNYAETERWRDALDVRIARFLTAWPELDLSPRAGELRFHRRVAPGMSQDEVVLLLGLPDSRTDDRAAMARAAAHFWSRIGPGAKQMWVYPGGWRLYFDGDRLADVTVRAPAF